MQKYQHFNFLTNLIYATFKLSLVVLGLMSLSRLYLFITYGGASTYSFFEILDAFWLGARLDASMLAYLNALGIVLIFIIWLLRLKFIQKYLYTFFRFYFVVLLTLLAFLTFTDLTYFSFFGEHSTLMIFGVFDDDTDALFRTAFDNYNVPIVALLGVGFFTLLYFIIFKIIKTTQKFEFSLNWFKQLGFFLVVIVLVGLTGRGSVGIFPLAYSISDVSQDPLVNKLPQTPSFAILDSYTSYTKS